MMPDEDLFIHAQVHKYTHTWYKNGESNEIKCCSQQLQTGLGGVAVTCGR